MGKGLAALRCPPRAVHVLAVSQSNYSSRLLLVWFINGRWFCRGRPVKMAPEIPPNEMGIHQCFNEAVSVSVQSSVGTDVILQRRIIPRTAK